MSSKIARKTLAPVYRKALKTWRPVILYFGSEHCPACEMAGPVFRQIAEPYRHHAQIYMLTTSESPRHPDVTGTPTVLFYKELCGLCAPYLGHVWWAGLELSVAGLSAFASKPAKAPQIRRELPVDTRQQHTCDTPLFNRHHGHPPAFPLMTVTDDRQAIQQAHHQPGQSLIVVGGFCRKSGPLSHARQVQRAADHESTLLLDHIRALDFAGVR